MADHQLDVKGLLCPLPVLRARKAIRGIAAGETIEVLATDPVAPVDFAAYCMESGNELVASNEAEGTFTFLIKKGV